MGGASPATLQQVDLWGDLSVDLGASQPLICFDPRGLAVQAGACTGQPVVIRLRRGSVLDSVLVSATGRVTP